MRPDRGRLQIEMESMTLPVAQLGQPILRQTTQEVTPQEVADPAFQTFLDEMIATMRSARGVGLAAPQVFDRRRLFIADVFPPLPSGEKAAPGVFINPKLRDLSGEVEASWEGCLSFLELLVLVPRHRSLIIDYLDRTGAKQSVPLQGFPARVVQHEFDHLEGILTIDRAPSTRYIIKSSEIDAFEDDAGEAD